MMRIIYGIAALCWAVLLVGYWAGYYTPDSVDISLGLIAVTLILAKGAVE
ncbi:hypothetical protein MKY63_00830 [Paenibacillus sp. FSL R7-0189]